MEGAAHVVVRLLTLPAYVHVLVQERATLTRIKHRVINEESMGKTDNGALIHGICEMSWAVML